MRVTVIWLGGIIETADDDFFESIRSLNERTGYALVAVESEMESGLLMRPSCRGRRPLWRRI